MRGIQASAQNPFTIGIVILAAGIHVKGSAGKIKLIIKATERIRNPKISKILCGEKNSFIRISI